MAKQNIPRTRCALVGMNKRQPKTDRFLAVSTGPRVMLGLFEAGVVGGGVEDVAELSQTCLASRLRVAPIRQSTRTKLTLRRND